MTHNASNSNNSNIIDNKLQNLASKLKINMQILETINWFVKHPPIPDDDDINCTLGEKKSAMKVIDKILTEIDKQIDLMLEFEELKK